MYWYYDCFYKIGNSGVNNFDEITIYSGEKFALSLSNELEIENRMNIFSISRNRMNSDLLLKKLEWSIFYQDENSGTKRYAKSGENLKDVYEEERSFLTSGKRSRSNFF